MKIGALIQGLNRLVSVAPKIASVVLPKPIRSDKPIMRTAQGWVMITFTNIIVGCGVSSYSEGSESFLRCVETLCRVVTL